MRIECAKHIHMNANTFKTHLYKCVCHYVLRTMRNLHNALGHTYESSDTHIHMNAFFTFIWRFFDTFIWICFECVGIHMNEFSTFIWMCFDTFIWMSFVCVRIHMNVFWTFTWKGFDTFIWMCFECVRIHMDSHLYEWFLRMSTCATRDENVFTHNTSAHVELTHPVYVKRLYT